VKIRGMAHITGGGLPGNLSRVLPQGVRANIKKGSWRVPEIFRLMERLGNIPEDDMKKTFNMGIGYVMVLTGGTAGDAVTLLRKSGYPAFIIGDIGKGGSDVRYV
jgi:phosphoribosylformylglycinamidine cyclo-ligase